MKFQTKIFIALFSSTCITLIFLAILTFVGIEHFATLQFNQKYTKIGNLIAYNIVQIEESIERVSNLATKYLDSYIIEHGIPSDSELKKMADFLDVSQLTITDSEGKFVRDTITPPSEQSKGLFDFCSDYKKLLTGETQIEKTPIIPSFPYKGPFKFFMAPGNNRKNILEVGFHIKEISSLILKALKTDNQILSLGLLAPSGFNFGTFYQDGSLVEGEKKLDKSNENSYLLELKVPTSSGKCCECKIKGVSASDSGYNYTLRMVIDKSQLEHTKNMIKLIVFGILSIMVILFYFISRKISIILVERILIINSSVNQIQDTGNLDLKLNIHGNDEISQLAHHFNKMLTSLKKSQEQIIQFEKIKIANETAKQVAHDIRSPLAALNMVLGSLTSISEDKRILIRNAFQRINDIANSLLEKSKTQLPKNQNPTNQQNRNHEIENVRTIEFIPVLVDILVSEKRMQYRQFTGIHIEADLSDGFDAFSEINTIEFKRAISNLVNNAVEAFEKNHGQVIIKVSSIDKNRKIKISIQDNGKGIPASIINKLGQLGVSHGKDGTSSGSGLGLYHAKNEIESNGGSFEIESIEGSGTAIHLYLPKAKSPAWFAKGLNINNVSKIISLDDDTSIHNIWSDRIKSLNLKEIDHEIFQSGIEFEKYILNNQRNLTSSLFLIDYELLSQPSNGLEIIEKLQIQKQSILVTSRYDEKLIQEKAISLNLEILPKAFAGFIPILKKESESD